MARQKQRTPELRDRVLQTAVAMLADEGFSGFTTRRVAHGAATSIPAVYELFGDKAGLVREIFFEGFRQLHRSLSELLDTDDPRADLLALIGRVRVFVRDNPALAEVMFGRPFADFDPGAEEVTVGVSVRCFFIGRVRRCVDAGVIAGDPVDVAHVLFALCQGLQAQENAGWLGRYAMTVDRRWELAFDVALNGLRPGRRPPAQRHIG